MVNKVWSKALATALALCCLNGIAATLADCNASTAARVLQSSTLALPARAVWLDRHSIRWPEIIPDQTFKLFYSRQGSIAALVGHRISGADGGLTLHPNAVALPEAVRTRFKFVHAGVELRIAGADQPKLARLLRGQLVLVQQDQHGLTLHATQLQTPGILDDLYQRARQADDLGVTIRNNDGAAVFNVWAPTARQLAVCVYPEGTGPATMVLAMHASGRTGIWTALQSEDLAGRYYQYLVDVFVPGTGLVRNRVTDPYALSLTADSRRSYITRLDAAQHKPPGWDADASPPTVQAMTDMNVYELHVRDFSINDLTVTPEYRGKYLAFTQLQSNGMQHLTALAMAGITDIHLLPVFDFASVPEQQCSTPLIDPHWLPGSGQQQAAVTAGADSDCFNWGYDPYHYSVPEGSYATDAVNGATRIIEFRQMVAALHQSGLRIGMDVVYNHTFAAGQHEQSVLDRIVPGYYQRLSAEGSVEHSTCCENTATEHLMMGKLLIDSVLLWARQYHIDSFRFDLMAHQPRAVMESLQQQLLSKTGRQIQLLGEGWNFGEVADGARFVQASQRSLNGSGIATFNDRLRDAVRGGGSGQSGPALTENKGYINGASGAVQSAQAELLRAGLAGSIRDYVLTNADGKRRRLDELDYHGQPAGYVSSPGEVVNYVENHDNETLFDINVYKLPVDTDRTDRALIQMTGVAIVALSQGVAYFHAGIDLLRSKSMDGNSFNSGDWFNRLDWRAQDNYFGSGLPPEVDNGKNYALIKPLLENTQIKPGPAQIRLSRELFRDLIRIRSSSSLFHLRSAADIQQRLVFENVGPAQQAGILVGRLDGQDYRLARFRSILYLINVNGASQQIVLAQEKNKNYVLHPVQSSTTAADQRITHQARYDSAQGQFTLPAYSTVVFVEP